jgi:1-pyrroline-5-carboxylate dehydrogenase
MDSQEARAMLDRIGEFRNQRLTDFAISENEATFEAALTRVRAQFGEEHPLIIGGEAVYTGDTFASTNPAHPDQAIGVFAKAGPTMR